MIRRLLLLNGFAVISAVIYHASGWGFTAMFWWTDQYLPVSVPDFSQMGSLSYYALRFVEQAIIFSIPSFLFVSGFFIAFATGRDQQTVSWKVVGVRIKNLAIPYLVWTFGIVFLNTLQGQQYSFSGLLKEIAFGKAAPPYYFVPLLVQLYLLSPLLVRFARTHGRSLLLITALIQFSVQTLKYMAIWGVNFSSFDAIHTITANWFFPSHIFWFSLGITLKYNLPTLKNWLARFKWGLLGLTLVLIPIGMMEWELILRHSPEIWIATKHTLIDELYAFVFLLSFLAFDKVSFPRSKNISEIGTKSFGIYLAHSPVLEYASRGIYHLIPWVLGYQILFQPILIILGLGIPLGLMKLLERSPARRAYTYIFG